MIKKLLIPALLLGGTAFATPDIIENLLHHPVPNPFYIGASFTGARVESRILTNTDNNGDSTSKHLTMYGATIQVGHKFSENVAIEVESGFTTGSGSRDFVGKAVERKEKATIGGTDCQKDGQPLEFTLKKGPKTAKKLKLHRIPLFVSARWQSNIQNGFGCYVKLGAGVEFISGRLSSITGDIDEQIVGDTCDTVHVENKGKEAVSQSIKLKKLVRPAGQGEIGLTYDLAKNITFIAAIGGSFSQKKTLEGVVRVENVQAETKSLVQVGGLVPHVKLGVIIAI